MDIRLIAQLGELLERLKGEGYLRTDFESVRVATTLYAVYITWLVVLATSDDFPLQRLRDEMQHGIQLILSGLSCSPAAADRPAR
jgi:hypothetical protein